MLLGPNSLYIVTAPLLHGAFHWSLVHTDANGRATRHHWAPSSNRTAGRHVEQDVRDLGVVVACFQVTGYVPLDLVSLRRLCDDIDAPGTAAADQTKAWIVCVLAQLRDAGHLARAPPALAEIERRVQTRSAACELEYLNAFMFQRTYHPSLENV